MSYTLKQTAEEVQQAIDNALNIPRQIEITLLTTDWTASADGSYYTQTITIENSTADTKVDLQPTPEQVISLFLEEVTMFVGNDEGVTTVYAIGSTPSTNMTIKALAQEVTYL